MKRKMLTIKSRGLETIAETNRTNCQRQTYPAITIKQSNRFQESSRQVYFPYSPMAMILIIISAAKKAKMKWSNFSRILQRVVVHSRSLQGWYIPRVMQFRRMTAILILSNHVHRGLRKNHTKSRTFNSAIEQCTYI